MDTGRTLNITASTCGGGGKGLYHNAILNLKSDIKRVSTRNDKLLVEAYR